MPHSSDSEAFESADEEVDRAAAARTKHTKPQSQPTSSLAQQLAVQSLVDNTRTIQLEDDVGTKATVVATAKTAPQEKAADSGADGWDRWDDDDDNDTVVDNKCIDVKHTTTDKDNEKAAEDDGWGQWSDGDDDATPVSAAEQLAITTSTTASSSPAVDLYSKPNPLDRLASNNGAQLSSSGWGAWKPWGGVVSNLLTSATDGVASITSHVTSAIESGIGVPGPEEMARIQREEKNTSRSKVVAGTSANKGADEATAVKAANAAAEPRDAENTDDGTSQLFGQMLSGVTQIGNRVLTGGTQIGSRVLTGGLGTLEGIGKKTMEVLQENDPGLRNKRRMLHMDGGAAPVLSQILREAKESTEEAEKNLELAQKQLYKKQLHFETLFDDYHGLVHLEALEMLSRQSALKLQSLLAPLAGRALADLQETLDEVRELCDLGDPDGDESDDGMHDATELSQRLAADTEDLGVPADFADLVACWQRDTDWLAVEANQLDAQQLHDKALRCLAETSALAVHKLHKLAELLLVQERHSTANEADALVQMVGTLCWHLGGIATRFGGHLSRLGANAEGVGDLITSTFLEGSNSVSYIRDGFQLFVPILQLGAA